MLGNVKLIEHDFLVRFSQMVPHQVHIRIPHIHGYRLDAVALFPLVQLADRLSHCIKEYDRRIEAMASEKYGHTKLLRQVKGGGRSRP
jgi:hypothetical protein